MAMTAYTGVMGSGKTYEVVENVILSALANGRNVVTNVAGLQKEKIRDYILLTLGVDVEKQGSIIQITNEEVTQPDFFPSEDDVLETDTIVNGGDLVILDECWRWFATGEKLAQEHMKFFRMHRHFTNEETGVACDVVLIVQSIDDLQRKVRAVIEKTFVMAKHKDLGFPDRYVVSIYTGSRPSTRSFVEDFQRKYNPDIFTLYSSYSQKKGDAVAKEVAADSRGNLFNRPIIKYGIPFAVVMLTTSIWFMWKFFHPASKDIAPAVASGQVSPVGQVAALPQSEKSSVSTSSNWRLIGHYTKGGLFVFILSDSSGRIRHITNPPGFKITAGEYELALPDGEIITQWSGAAVQSLKPGGI